MRSWLRLWDTFRWRAKNVRESRNREKKQTAPASWAHKNRLSLSSRIKHYQRSQLLSDRSWLIVEVSTSDQWCLTPKPLSVKQQLVSSRATQSRATVIVTQRWETVTCISISVVHYITDADSGFLLHWGRKWLSTLVVQAVYEPLLWTVATNTSGVLYHRFFNF